MGGKSKKDIGAVLDPEGVSFRVWAPFASAVSVTGAFNDWSETPMDSENDGYWQTYIKDAQAGQEYKFIIQNGNDKFYRNDPRAKHLTTTAGNSVIVDTADFDWEGAEEFKLPSQEKQVIYEMHVGTFYRPDLAVIGNFEAAAEKLDYLKDLGVNVIEVMPVGSMPMDRGWGYATNYIYSVESLYGGRRAFLDFIKAAHKKDIGVVLDVVYNHFGPGEGLDLWSFDGWSQDGKGGIYFYNDWRSQTPWGDTRPDYGRQEVRQYILDNVVMWLNEFKLDGLRVDSTIYIRNVQGYNDDPGNDLPDGWSLLQAINDRARKVNPNALMIGEDVGANDFITRPTREGGAGFGAQWDVTYPQSFREALCSDDPGRINMYGIAGQLTKRFNGDSFHRIAYVDSHDTAANGSARLAEVISGGDPDSTFARRQSLLAAAILLTTPAIPMLLQGQEFMQDGGFTDWQGLEWERAEKYSGIVEAFKHLIALRKDDYGVSAGLAGHDVNIINADDNNKTLVYHRWKNGGPKDDTVVILNFGNHAYNDYVLNFPRDGVWKMRFNSAWRGYSPDFKQKQVEDVVVQNGQGTVVLPASAALIFSQDD